MITATDELLETLARGCDGQISRVAYPDPWGSPGYPVALQAFLGGPLAQRCRRWLAGDGLCRHYAALLVTVGCVREHVWTRPSCACCLAEMLAAARDGRRIGCAEEGCREHALIGQYALIYGQLEPGSIPAGTEQETRS